MRNIFFKNDIIILWFIHNNRRRTPCHNPFFSSDSKNYSSRMSN